MSDDDSDSSLPRRRQSIVTSSSELLPKLENFLSQEDGSVLMTFTGPSAVDTLSTFASAILARIEASDRHKILMLVYDVEPCFMNSFHKTTSPHGYGNVSQLICVRSGHDDPALISILLSSQMTPAFYWTHKHIFHSDDEQASQLIEKFDIELVIFCSSQGDDATPPFPQSLTTRATRSLIVKLDNDEDSDDDTTTMDTSSMPTPKDNSSDPVAHTSPQPTPPVTPNVNNAESSKRAIRKARMSLLFDRFGIRPTVGREPATLVPIQKRRVALGQRAYQCVLRRYRGSYNFRKAAAKREEGRDEVCIPAHLLVKPNSFERALDTWLKQSLVNRLHLQGLSIEAVRKIGYTSCYMLAYLRMHDGRKNMEASQLFEVLRRMSEEELTATAVEYHHFYGSLPTARVPVKKRLHCGGDRAEMKEVSTNATNSRGVISVFVLFGVIPMSSRMNPCKKGLMISNALKASTKEMKVIGCGSVRDDRLPLGSYDLTLKMEQSRGVTKEADLQSWLLGQLLVGTGLRPGSVQERQGFVPEKDGDHGEDDVNRVMGGDELVLDFAGLRSRHVTVYRVKRLPSDPPAVVRILCELEVMHQKTTGLQAYTPTTIGLPYPRLRPDGSWDWRPSAGLALALVSIGAGIVPPERLYSQLYEPDDHTVKRLISDKSNPDVPLFKAHGLGNRGGLRRDEALRYVHLSMDRLLDSLGLPHAQFSARSFRCGFAQDISADVIMRIDDATTVTKEDLRRSLHSSNAWASKQSDVYMRHVFNSIIRFTQTTSCSTAADWLITLHKNSPSARPSFKYVSKAKFAEAIMDEEVDKRELKQTWCASVGAAYRDAEIVEATTAEIRARYVSDGRFVDMKRTVDAYARVMGIEKANIPYSEALGYYYKHRDPPYKCPGCLYSSRVVDDSIGHWKECHGTSKLREDDTFKCPCGSGQASTWKSLRQHIENHKNHKYDKTRKPVPFKFHYI